MSPLGVLGALLIGLSLGLLGSGGSVITVPVLLLFFALEPALAIVTSLLVVAGIAAFGTWRAGRSRRIDWRAFWHFAPAAMLAASLGSAVGARLPDRWQLLIFAALAGVAAWRMLAPAPAQRAAASAWWLLLAAGITGFFTGLVGVGGGFLIVPALVLVAGLPMASATATSLPVIALSAASGFLAYCWHWPQPGGPPLPWATAALVSACGIGGMVVGQTFAGRLPEVGLRRVFAVVLVMLAMYLTGSVMLGGGK